MDNISDPESLRIRQQMEETRAALADKLGALERQVTGTVETVKDSVSTVRNAFDLELQAQERPWVLLGGAVAVGFWLGYRSSAGRVHQRVENVRNIREARYLAQQSQREGGSGGERTDILGAVGHALEKEASLVKGLAVGAVLGIVRDLAAGSVSGPMERYLEDAVEGVTRRLGVRPLPRAETRAPSEGVESGVASGPEKTAPM